MSTPTISREARPRTTIEEYEKIWREANLAQADLCGPDGGDLLSTMETLAAEGECYTAFVRFMDMAQPGDKRLLAIILDAYVDGITRDVLIDPRIKRYRDLCLRMQAERETITAEIAEQ